MTHAVRGALCVVVVALAVAAGVQHAHAAFAETLLAYSAQLRSFDGRGASDRTFELNGARLHLSTETGLVIRSECPLRLREMFPDRGDAAGADLSQVPRPRGARRLLSARLSNGQYDIVAYEVSGSAAQALRGYLVS